MIIYINKILIFALLVICVRIWIKFYNDWFFVRKKSFISNFYFKEKNIYNLPNNVNIKITKSNKIILGKNKGLYRVYFNFNI